jgi:hypothetical protein
MAHRTISIRGRGWEGFDNKTGRRRRFLRKSLLTLLLVVLVAGLVGGSLWLVARNRAVGAYDRFSAEFTDSDYPAALQTYRDVQERALQEPTAFSYTTVYQDALQRMESFLSERVRSVYERLPAAEGLDAASRAMLDGMQEVSGMILARLARVSCVACLDGTGDIPATRQVLEQLLAVQGASSAMQGLLDAIPDITSYQPAFVAANRAQAEERWLDAATAFLGMVDDSGGFVGEIALTRLDACRTAMREPVFAEVAALMEGSRFYTALERLQLLDRIYPDDAEVASLLAQCRSRTSAELEVWTGIIEYVAVRPLIADTASAFDGDTYAQVANDAMLTTYEFRRILQQLYDRGYILVDLPSLFDFQTVEGQTVSVRRTLRLPVGKKPIVFGIEGLNYYAARHRTGNSVSLSLDAQGRVVSTYPSADGLRTDAEGEAIGILESFLAEHPDFSFNGARGTISLTGYECIFGAITDRDQLDDRNLALENNGEAPVSPTDAQIATNRKEAIAIMKVLSSHGWTFASSTYGGIDVSRSTKERIATDTAKWTAQVASMTGAVDILVYPNGSWLKNSDARIAILKEAGFRIYCGIGATPYLSVGKDTVFIDRVLFNGYSLAHTDLSRFLDVKEVLDPARP